MNSRESNRDELSLRLRGERPIGLSIDAARQFGAEQLLTKEALARLCIVIEELIANLYDHGGVTDRDEVELTLRRDPQGIRIFMVDPGAPFNSWSAPPASEQEIRGGGAGIRLIQAWAELVSYRSSSGANRLELLLPLPPQS